MTRRNRNNFVTALAVVLAPFLQAQQTPPAPGTISTIVVTGSGVQKPPVLNASPSAICVDSYGNLVVADNNNNRVVRVGPSTGILTAIAGTGTPGFSGDRGPAVQALLNSPYAVAVDAAGNVFIADSGNNRIRRVDAYTGTITTFAGTGAASSGGDGGPAIQAGLNAPLGIVFDSSGNLYIAEEQGNRVRRVDAQTSIIATIAGNGTAAFTPDGAVAAKASLAMPGFLAFDNAGNLLISELGSYRIRRVDGNGILTTVAGNGGSVFNGDGMAAASTAVGMVGQPAMDAAGNLYLPGLQEYRVFRLDAASGLVYTVAGNGIGGGSFGDGGLATSANLSPLAVALLSNGNLAIADAMGFSVRQVALPSPYVYTATSVTGPASATVGQAATLTATVTPIGASGVPTGSVQFHYNYTSGTAALVNGTASLAITAPAYGSSFSVTASYLGDNVYSTSTSPLSTVPITLQAVTTVTLSSAQNPAPVQQSVTFTVAISPGSSSYQPTGSVQLLDGSAVIATGAVQNGSATFSVSFTVTGPHSLTAVYSGDANFRGGTSAVLSESVRNLTTGSLTSNPPFPTLGSPVTFTATVNQSAATGSFQFQDYSNSGNLVTLGSAAVVNGSASFTTSSLSAGSHYIGATYSGDAYYMSFTTALILQPVNFINTTVSLSSTPNPAPLQQTVTVTATVTPAVSYSSAPTGLVNLSDGSTWLANAPLQNNTVVFSISFNSAGTHSLSAIYAGDANYQGATALGYSQNIVKAATTVTLTSSLNPSVAGQSVTFSAAISPAAATGAVQFLDGATVLGSVTIANGAASLALSSLAPGAHSLTAVYGGDGNDAAGSSPVLTQTVSKAPASVALSASPNPSTFGQAVTFSATVSPSSATGSMQFLDGATPVGTVNVAGGTASLTVSALAAGTHLISAAYSGDATHLAANSASSALTVNKAASAATIGSSANPGTNGQPVVLTVLVSPGAATGSVQFVDGNTAIGTAVLSGGTGSIQTSSLAAGTHSISASYSGDANYAGSSTGVLIEVVKVTTATSLSSNGTPTTYGRQVQFTASVSPNTATGSVQFMDGAAVLGTVALSKGRAQLAASSLSAGSHPVTAIYSGDATRFSSLSAVWTQTVNKAAASVSLKSSLNPSTTEQSITFTASVSPAAATGSVQFLDGSLVLGTAARSGGTATVTVSNLAAGPHKITAAYSGDTNYNSAVSGVLTENVNKVSTITRLASSLNPSARGQSVSLTATIFSAGGTGTVQFLDGGKSLGTVALSGSTATWTTNTLTSGTHSITAVYSGDTSFGGSTSAVLRQVVK